MKIKASTMKATWEKWRKKRSPKYGNLVILTADNNMDRFERF